MRLEDVLLIYFVLYNLSVFALQLFFENLQRSSLNSANYTERVFFALILENVNNGNMLNISKMFKSLCQIIADFNCMTNLTFIYFFNIDDGVYVCVLDKVKTPINAWILCAIGIGNLQYNLMMKVYTSHSKRDFRGAIIILTFQRIVLSLTE